MIARMTIAPERFIVILLSKLWLNKILALNDNVFHCAVRAVFFDQVRRK
jgi:hypothetical protein